MGVIVSMAVDPKKYRDLKVSVPVSILAAQSIVGHSQKENYFELFPVPDYYPALLGNATMAFITFFYINRVDSYLERVQQWNAGFRIRLFMQIVYGGLGALLISFLMGAFYFESYDYHIGNTVYFVYYFLPIVFYVITINIYYNAEYIPLLRDPSRNRSGILELEDRIVETADRLELESARLYLLQNNIALIKIVNGFPMAWNNMGQPQIWDYTIRASRSICPPDDYYQVSRSCIVRGDIITNVIHEPENKRLYLQLTSAFNDTLQLPKEANIGFLTWFRKYQEQPRLMHFIKEGENYDRH